MMYLYRIIDGDFLKSKEENGKVWTIHRRRNCLGTFLFQKPNYLFK
jgi:hypothetical protein